MAPTWHMADGASSLFAAIVENSVLYAISLGLLIIFARLLVLIPRKYFGTSSEATFKAWVLCSIWLALGHSFAIYSFYDKQLPLLQVLGWAMITTAGLTVGLGLAGGVITMAIVICYKYL